MTTFIGTSGWSYDGWRGPFYPEGLAASRWLEYASRKFDSIEINASFYRLQRPETFRRWYEQTPDDFVFAVKGSRYITHNRKLRNVAAPLKKFFASLDLGRKLGPILWQLPENLHYDEERIESFFAMLPARRRYAIEPRHDSYCVESFVRLCRKHRVAIVISDSADWPTIEEVTAGFVYLRLHGSTKTYASRYGDAELDHWAERIGVWEKRGTVYAYFDNDAHAHAPGDALRLIQRLRDDVARP